MLIDLHNHTIPLSIDSGLRAEKLIELARRRGLDAILLTEHDRLWDAEALARVRGLGDLIVLAGCEVTTQVGHVIAIGLSAFRTEFHDLATLRRAADADGAILIAAHPLRDGQRIAGHPELLPLFDAVEAFNGTESVTHNDLAARLAADRGLPAVGGSDAHTDYEVGLGATEVEGDPRDEAGLIAAIVAGRVRPVDLRAATRRD